MKTDSGRLLWTWILPYLDIEGRYFADPDLIKGKVVPRLKTFTAEIIADCLTDMARVGLITLYEHDGERYLQFRNFHEFQNLRSSKEAKSKIPPPGQLPDNSGTTPGILPHNIREVKGREVKAADAAPFVLPSKEEIQEASDPKIEECIDQVCTKLYEEKIFPDVYAFKGKVIKGKKNGRGLLHVLARCYIAKPEDPWAYCQKIIAVEDLNYNERDYRKTAQ